MICWEKGIDIHFWRARERNASVCQKCSWQDGHWCLRFIPLLLTPSSYSTKTSPEDAEHSSITSIYSSPNQRAQLIPLVYRTSRYIWISAIHRTSVKKQTAGRMLRYPLYRRSMSFYPAVIFEEVSKRKKGGSTQGTRISSIFMLFGSFKRAIWAHVSLDHLGTRKSSPD